MDYKTTVKVDRKVKPIHFKDRHPIELIEGNRYFVSFGNNFATPCTLIAFEGEETVKRITIEIPTKAISKHGFIDINGNTSHRWVSTHSLFSDEIGLTSEEAVINEVTF